MKRIEAGDDFFRAQVDPLDVPCATDEDNNCIGSYCSECEFNVNGKCEEEEK